MGQCADSRCEVEVVWLLNDNTGRRAPIEVRTNPKGNVTIDRVEGTYHVLTLIQMETTPDQLKHMNHFTTCEYAEAFKGRCPHCRQSPCIKGPGCAVVKPKSQTRKKKAAVEPPPTLF